MEWVPVESSVLEAVAYSPGDHELCLKFHSGAEYCYFDFPSKQYGELLGAESLGRYFSREIRDRFRYRKIR
jgi:ATP-dependent DNA helicase RecG